MEAGESGGDGDVWNHVNNKNKFKKIVTNLISAKTCTTIVRAPNYEIFKTNTPTWGLKDSFIIFVGLKDYLKK